MPNPPSPYNQSRTSLESQSSSSMAGVTSYRRPMQKPMSGDHTRDSRISASPEEKRPPSRSIRGVRVLGAWQDGYSHQMADLMWARLQRPQYALESTKDVRGVSRASRWCTRPIRLAPSHGECPNWRGKMLLLRPQQCRDLNRWPSFEWRAERRQVGEPCSKCMPEHS